MKLLFTSFNLLILYLKSLLILLKCVSEYLHVSDCLMPTAHIVIEYSFNTKGDVLINLKAGSNRY